MDFVQEDKMRKQDLGPSDLKAILCSKRANLYYLERCRVMQKDGRIVYLTESTKENLYWNIPIANTTVLLLGPGTSITQAAVRLIAGAGVMIGFCGSGGTPLLAGTEIEWLSPQSEYRPTEYVQGWLSFWFNEEKRLAVAKEFQRARCRFLERTWEKDRDLADGGFYVDDELPEKALNGFRHRIERAATVTELLTGEARFTKDLYKYAAQTTEAGPFERRRDGEDRVNGFLNHGNYLAYGLGAVTLWVLGIPHGFAVMHGKTRRGALVFDVADLIKDAIILPWAFLCAQEEKELSTESEKHFRQMCLRKFAEHRALDYMFDTVKRCSRMFVAEAVTDK